MDSLVTIRTENVRLASHSFIVEALNEDDELVDVEVKDIKFGNMSKKEVHTWLQKVFAAPRNFQSTEKMLLRDRGKCLACGGKIITLDISVHQI